MGVNPRSRDPAVLPRGHRSNGVFGVVYKRVELNLVKTITVNFDEDSCDLVTGILMSSNG